MSYQYRPQQVSVVGPYVSGGRQYFGTHYELRPVPVQVPMWQRSAIGPIPSPECSVECWESALKCQCCSVACWKGACCSDDTCLVALTNYCGCINTVSTWKNAAIGALRTVLGVATIATPTLVALGNGSYHKQPPYINTAVTVAYSICLGVSLLHAMYSIKKNCCHSEEPSTRWQRHCKYMDPGLTLISLGLTATIFGFYLAIGVPQPHSTS